MQVCRAGLFTFESSETLFNQYADEDRSLDRPGAAEIRRANLVRHLESYERVPEVVVVAEAPGPWGCRYSGVPITSEEQLRDPGFPISGKTSGSGAKPHGEYSARIFWRVMRAYFPVFLVWNAVPLHPHRVGEPMTIRTPRVSEVRSWAWLTEVFVGEVAPTEVVALGRKAESQLIEAGIGCTYVRHPSQGGAVAFEEGMRKVFATVG